ncbi:MAG: ribonuclease HI [Clostridiales bacterium]|jgi:ribonuclease HI|nr:ribonuclease HI [Clostridiales bacterium]
MKKIIIYTDGACSNNPGKGGYGAILLYKGIKKEISAGYLYTTNNRMELLAAVAALEQLKEPCDVELYSDSKYIVDAINKGWAARWQKNNWMRNKTDKAINPDLWERLLALISKHKTKFIWVKGHADNEFNNQCDFLARQAILSSNLLTDENYS